MISVIVPVYNTKPYLARCLQSVRQQTHKDWECIVVDDGSTDGSIFEICRLMEAWNNDKRFRVLSFDKNMGLPAARNNAMDIAGGDKLFFLDSDDWIERDALSQLDAESGVHPEVGRVVGLDMVHHTRHGWNIPWSIEPAGLHEADSPYLFSGPGCDPGHATGCLYLRKNMPDDLRFPEVKLFEDMIFNMGLMFAGASTFVTKRYLYHYERRDDSLLSVPLGEEEAEVTRGALRALRGRCGPKPEVYERCRRFLENALQGKLKANAIK